MSPVPQPTKEISLRTYDDGPGRRFGLARRAASDIGGSGLAVAAKLGRLHPLSRPERHSARVTRDIPYRDTGSSDHFLDVYTPENLSEPAPVVLYIHGGAFQLLSKETHWMMGLTFAGRGYVVASINYRLAPGNKFPAAAQDAAAAYQWVVENIDQFGGDPSRIVVAGESAGANLAASLAIMTTYERTESWARDVFETGVVPKACLPACGILQVSDTQRYRRRRRLPKWVYAQIEQCEAVYLEDAELCDGGTDLADPLLVIESDVQPVRDLPAFFALVGTRDPLLDDTRRLERALERRGVDVEARYYRGGIHAFHALTILPTASRSWADKFAFLDRVLADHSPAVPSQRQPTSPRALDDWYA